MPKADYQKRQEKNYMFKDRLPPGIQISTLPIQESFLRIQNEDFKSAKRYINGPRYQNGKPAGWWEFQFEPATYLCDAMSGVGGKNTEIAGYQMVNSKNKNSDPMIAWAKGIGYYVNKWVKKESDYDIEGHIEKPLLAAIFLAANKRQGNSRVEQYLKGDDSQKNRILNVTMNELENTRNYRDQLIAAWASTWLVNHYSEIQINIDKSIKEKRIQMNMKIEKPLRNIIRIRGPPYYYDDKGGFKA